MLCPNLFLWAVLVVAVSGASEGETSDEVPIIKQINRVNEDGTYTFGYEAADGSFKIETRDVLGNVKGMFGFIDETGELKRVSYTASNGTGFQATGNIPEPRERRPILVLRHPNPSSTTTRAPVIQHIPRRGATARAESNTTPVYAEYGQKEHTTGVLSSTTAHTTTTEEPVTRPVRILVTKRPVDEGKTVNLIRRQLGQPQDRQEVYNGGRRIYLDPRDVYRNMLLEQSDLKPELPRYYLAEDSPEVPAVVPMVDRVLRARLPPPLPRYRSAVEPLPYRPALARLPQRIYDDYDQPLDLEALRDEIMNYLIQYLQYRARRINPYYTPYLEPPQPYYPPPVVSQPRLQPPPPYYPRNLPITPSPNIQYSDQGQQMVVRMRQDQAEGRSSPLIRMLLAAPQQRPPSVRSVEILGTAASTTTARPVTQTTTETPDEMEASS